MCSKAVVSVSLLSLGISLTALSIGKFSPDILNL